VGRTADVLIESEEPAGELLGRTATQAPEIDGVIRVRGEAAPGDLVRVRVTGAGTYDLAGEIIPEVDSPAPAH
jgi:ribosomal protein S12 methylthiotransferase